MLVYDSNLMHYRSLFICGWCMYVILCSPTANKPTSSRKDTSVKDAKSPIIVIIITIIIYFDRFSCLKLWFDFLVSCVFAFFLCSCLHCVLCGVYHTHQCHSEVVHTRIRARRFTNYVQYYYYYYHKTIMQLWVLLVYDSNLMHYRSLFICGWCMYVILRCVEVKWSDS